MEIENLKKKFKIITLGCRTNQYESQAYKDQLIKLGYSEALSSEKADLCIVNTCTVTENADKKSLYQIKQLAKKYPLAKIVVTGCLLDRKNSPLKNLDDSIFFVPNADKENLMQYIFPQVDNLPEFQIERFSAHTRAFVKVQDGCNSYCSYCIIPYVRGRSRSKTIEAITSEIKILVENGFKEVVLTGINIGDFDGQDASGQTRLAHLVKAVDAIEGLQRIRISSIDPDEVDRELIDVIKQSKNVCHSMHVVLQAGSNSVLKRMRRKYTKQEFFRCIQDLRNAFTDFTFTTDIIVGFPGETDQDFEETLNVVQKIKFAKVHAFPFSIRPGTKAERMDQHIAPEIIQKRRMLLSSIAEKSAFELRQQYMGHVLNVLIEDEDPVRKGYLQGYSQQFILVSFPKKRARKNDIVSVKITRNDPDGLIGEIV